MSCLIKFIFSILALVTVFFQAVPAIATNQDAGRHFYVELEAGPVWQANNDTVYTSHGSTMHQEVVEKHGWLRESQFLRALNFCMLLPGPEAQQLTTYIGWRLHGTLGCITAGVLFVIPSIFILLFLSYLAAACLLLIQWRRVPIHYMVPLGAGIGIIWKLLMS